MNSNSYDRSAVTQPLNAPVVPELPGRAQTCLLSISSGLEYRALLNRQLMNKLRQSWETTTQPIVVRKLTA